MPLSDGHGREEVRGLPGQQTGIVITSHTLVDLIGPDSLSAEEEEEEFDCLLRTFEGLLKLRYLPLVLRLHLKQLFLGVLDVAGLQVYLL